MPAKGIKSAGVAVSAQVLLAPCAHEALAVATGASPRHCGGCKCVLEHAWEHAPLPSSRYQQVEPLAPPPAMQLLRRAQCCGTAGAQPVLGCLSVCSHRGT